MKIGILTFHWATNYGAVLQTYATQTYLESLGHDVVVINYKPTIYDNTFKSLLREFKKKNIGEHIKALKKEKVLQQFRTQYLHQTKRIVSCDNLTDVIGELDCIISGSDQVMNPTFLMMGEGYGKFSPTYFLGFDYSGKRIAYAVSYGVVEYPEKESLLAKPYIAKFDRISTREASGVKIVNTMGRNDAVIVPDPTILLEYEMYHKLASSKKKMRRDCLYCFFIRHIAERKASLNALMCASNALWNNEDGDYSLEGWLSKIENANVVLTDSFHCMVMCLKLHTPFAVVTEMEGNIGMNDRLYTLLGIVGLEDRIIYKKNVNIIPEISKKEIDWAQIDKKIEEYKTTGVEFLKSI